MSAAHVEPSIEDIAAQVVAQIAADGLALVPKRIITDTYVNILDEEAWWLDLVLPAPVGGTWEWEETSVLKKAVMRDFDRRIDGTSWVLPGRTLVRVITDEVRQDPARPLRSFEGVSRDGRRA